MADLAAPAQSAPPQTEGSNPLVRRLGLQQLIERDAEQAPQAQTLGEDTWTSLASHVRAAWGRNKLAKQRVDLKLLDCLRARRGVYSAAAISQMQSTNGGMNIVWADLTETKCRAASAWIREIVLPVGEQPWSVSPSPVPDLPMDIKKSVVNKALEQAQQVMQQSAQAGGGTLQPEEFRDLALTLGDKLKLDAEKTYKKLAKARAEAMERTLADRMAQGNYESAMDGFVEDFVTYPAAILKGPVYARHKQLEWGDGWKPKVSNNPAQTWERVSPFDVYPAPSSHSPQQGDFIERIRFRREELFDLKGLPNYHDEQIDGALDDYSNGHLEGWLWTEAERQRLEQETMYMWLSPPGVIDALSYWGSIPGWKLMSFGVPNLEEFKDYECNVVICGRYVLYAALNPDVLGQRPYRRACYDEIPGAFWGRSIPDLSATSQKMCNAIACALADNLSIASGPQSWVHIDRLADGEQSLEQFPWKVWQLKSDPTQGTNPGVGFFQPDDRSANLMATYEKWEIRADDATGIPRYTYGNERAGGSADTATGLSMLMNNAAKGLRRAISNIDLNVIQPTVNTAFVNEMIYNPDESIKGDCFIVPRGAAAILIRESAQQRRIQFLGLTANPIDAQIITAPYRAALLRETAAAMELPVDDVVPSEDAIAAQMQAQQQAAQAQQQGMLQAEQQKQQGEQQTVAMKESAITQREQQGHLVKIIADVVSKAVEAAMHGHKLQLAKTIGAVAPPAAAPSPAPATVQ
jgi:hypothetical protein